MLPLSRGRLIRMAEPKYVARLLIGLALTDDPRLVARLVEHYGAFRPVAEFDGSKPPETLERAIELALREGWPGRNGGENEPPTSGLASVEFEPDDHPPSVSVKWWGNLFKSQRYVEDPDNMPADIVIKPLVRKIEMSGILIHRINRSVVWGESEG